VLTGRAFVNEIGRRFATCATRCSPRTDSSSNDRRVLTGHDHGAHALTERASDESTARIGLFHARNVDVLRAHPCRRATNAHDPRI
jgi:hypothetical protein